MFAFLHPIRLFCSDESGATAIEYGMIAALMAVSCIAAFTVAGDGIKDLFGTTTDGAGGAITSAASSL